MGSSLKVLFSFGDTMFSTYRGGRLHCLCTDMKREFPKLKMYRKRDCWWHWVVHVLICILTIGFNRRYMRDFTTSFKDRVYWSEHLWNLLQNGCSEDHDRVWETLMHERVHLRQFKSEGVAAMVITWLFPPVLLCYGRAILIEKPAYLISLQCRFKLNRRWAEGKEYRSWWISNFTGASYGWSWVLRHQVARWFDDELARLQKEAGDGSTGG